MKITIKYKSEKVQWKKIAELTLLAAVFVLGAYGVLQLWYLKIDNNSGFYLEQENYYVVKPANLDMWSVMQIAQHETGHYIFARLPVEMQEEWKNISSSGLPYVSEYAKTNYNEDFAESYELAVECNFVPLPLAVGEKGAFMQRVFEQQESPIKYYEYQWYAIE